MEIFVGNLPGEAALTDLRALVGDFVMRADLQCCQGRDRNDRSYHYFIVRVASHSEGQALLRRLDGTEFAGRRLVAREYVQRRPVGDWIGEERRVNP